MPIYSLTALILAALIWLSLHILTVVCRGVSLIGRINSLIVNSLLIAFIQSSIVKKS